MAKYKLNSADAGALTFVEGGVKSVLQNIALLLNTVKGTLPMYREFGLEGEFIDKPVEVAETLAFSEITEALEKFEPRAVLENVYFEKSESGGLSITVEVDIPDE